MKNQWPSFRLWVNKRYYEAMSERSRFNQRYLTISEYWNRYKYWLKSEYKNRKNGNPND